MKHKFSIVGFTSVLLALTTLFALTACRKNFDEPYIGGTTIPTNSTIKQLKSLNPANGQFIEITNDIVFSAVVTANDKSGNIYKQLYVQDSTAGIALEIDATGMYNQFPVGREVFVRAKGLYLVNEAGMIKLALRAIINGTPSVAGIPTTLLDRYVVRGSIGKNIAPKVVTLAQLNDLAQYQSMLIQLNDFEVTNGDLNKTYADTSANKATQNINLKDCSGNSIIVRTSGYANFAGIKVPQGNGPVVAIFTVFGTTKQLLIRDTSDMKMTNPRCGSGPTTLVNISAIRALYTGTPTNVPQGQRIEGIVISERVANNLDQRNVVIQQGDNLSGITVRFQDPHTFNVGDKLAINISGVTLDEFNGTLQISGVANNFASVIGTGTITPRVVTASEFNNNINFEAWESTLLKMNNVSITGGTGGTWNGTTVFADATGTVKSFTRSAATFSANNFPANATSVVGIASQFNADKQLNLRNVSDVVAGSGGVGGTNIQLTTSPFILDFNNIGSGLPTGVTVRTSATASSLGTLSTFNSTPALWNNFTFGFKNYASATGLSSSADSATQVNATNRALGVRQTSSSDMGAAFVFEIANTTGKNNLKLEFLLQSLDATVGRTTTWTVDYGIGDNPTSFTAAPPASGTMTTSPAFSSNPIVVNFPAALNNVSSKVWIRIVVLQATTGSGNRPSSAIDDVKFSWN